MAEREPAEDPDKAVYVTGFGANGRIAQDLPRRHYGAHDNRATGECRLGGGEAAPSIDQTMLVAA